MIDARQSYPECLWEKNTTAPLERQGMWEVENRVGFLRDQWLAVTEYQKFPDYNFRSSGKNIRMPPKAGANRTTFQMCSVQSVVSGTILRLCHQCHTGP